MALNLPDRGSGEDRTPIVKYDARAGRLFRVDRTQADGSWESETVEITPVFQAVMDLEHIELGWLYFPTNGAPEIEVAPYGQPLPAKPAGGKARPGFRVHMKLGKTCGGDIREMAANAQVSIKGMDKLHDAYLKDAPAHPGQLPVVKLGTTVAVASQGKGADGKPVVSQNYEPCWEIIGWVPRPVELVLGGGVANDGTHAGTTQMRTTQQQLPEPEPEPVKLPSITDDF
jgi:hypothetical protein